MTGESADVVVVVVATAGNLTAEASQPFSACFSAAQSGATEAGFMAALLSTVPSFSSPSLEVIAGLVMVVVVFKSVVVLAETVSS